MDPQRLTTISKYKDLKTLVEIAIRSFRTNCGKSYTKTGFNTFRWTNIQCPKQVANDGIYCGCYVGRFIEDVLCFGETVIPVNFTHSQVLKLYTPGQMVHFQNNWGGYLYNRFLKGKMLK